MHLEPSRMEFYSAATLKNSKAKPAEHIIIYDTNKKYIKDD